jgi:hypothetical protein
VGRIVFFAIVVLVILFGVSKLLASQEFGNPNLDLFRASTWRGIGWGRMPVHMAAIKTVGFLLVWVVIAVVIVVVILAMLLISAIVTGGCNPMLPSC